MRDNPYCRRPVASRASSNLVIHAEHTFTISLWCRNPGSTGVFSCAGFCPQVDQLIADEKITSGTSGTVHWPLTDHLGNVRDLVTFNGTTTTNVEHRVFDSFGNLVSDNNSTLSDTFSFTGRFFDVDTKLQWNLNRWYDPFLGQWLNEDPIGFNGGDENLRRYVGNEVLLLTDPSGLHGYGGQGVPTIPSEQEILQHLNGRADEWERKGWALAAFNMRQWLSKARNADTSAYAKHYLKDERFRDVVFGLVVRNGARNARNRVFAIDAKQKVHFGGETELFYAHYGLNIHVKGNLCFDEDGRFAFDGVAEVSDGYTFKPTGIIGERLLYKDYLYAHYLETKYGYNIMKIKGVVDISFKGPPLTFDFNRL